MTTKLSFTISGKKKDVTRRAALFMETMSKVMGKEMNGITLVNLDREDKLVPAPREDGEATERSAEILALDAMENWSKEIEQAKKRA